MVRMTFIKTGYLRRKMPSAFMDSKRSIASILPPQPSEERSNLEKIKLKLLVYSDVKIPLRTVVGQL